MTLRTKPDTGTAHTEGPWFLEGKWDPSGENVGGWVSSFPPSGVPVFELVPCVGSKEEICANARLIAAAPDMLAELRRQVDWLRHVRPQLAGKVPGSVVTGLDQAIKYMTTIVARAEGRQP